MTTTQIILIYLAILLFALTPVFLAFLSEGIGKWLGGKDANGKLPERWGIAFGQGSQSMVVMGWLALLTGPAAMLAAISFTAYLIWGI